MDAIGEAGSQSYRTAFKLGEKVDASARPCTWRTHLHQVTADLAGHSRNLHAVLRLRMKEKLPIGLQILGRHFDESTVLRVAQASEKAA